MATLTINEFRARFPEFDEPVATDAQVQQALTEAAAIHHCCSIATLFLAAHLLSIELDRAGNGGGGLDGGAGGMTLASATVGSESVSYQSGAADPKDSFFFTSSYGRQYLAHRNACPARKAKSFVVV